jgi:hypothetical protein
MLTSAMSRTSTVPNRAAGTSRTTGGSNRIKKKNTGAQPSTRSPLAIATASTASFLPSLMPPPELFEPPTASAINQAKGAELDHWISQLNAVAELAGGSRQPSTQAGDKRKALTKQGTMEEQRCKIARFLGIDLAQTSSDIPIPCPLTVDRTIGRQQWAWARTLAQEWAEAEAAGVSFKLWPQSSGCE